jgi:hypothetical protein
VVGVYDHVIEGVHDFRARALAQLSRPAVRGEPAKRCRVAPEVSRTVIAHHVQHNDCVVRDVSQVFTQRPHQDLIEALSATATMGRETHI